MGQNAHHFENYVQLLGSSGWKRRVLAVVDHSPSQEYSTRKRRMTENDFKRIFSKNILGVSLVPIHVLGTDNNSLGHTGFPGPCFLP